MKTYSVILRWPDDSEPTTIHCESINELKELMQLAINGYEKNGENFYPYDVKNAIGTSHGATGPIMNYELILILDTEEGIKMRASRQKQSAQSVLSLPNKDVIN